MPVVKRGSLCGWQDSKTAFVSMVSKHLSVPHLTVPACPANSVRSSTGTCVCNTGYPGGTISWTGSAWAGSCGVRQSCPLNAAYNTATPATCVCKSGFTGTPSWIGTGPWTGSCVEAACPANAARVSAGVCKCNVGNPGTTTWSGAAWSNSCAAQVNCPANASYNSTGYCKCNPSYSGGLTWTASGWTGTCSLSMSLYLPYSLSACLLVFSCYPLLLVAFSSAALFILLRVASGLSPHSP